MNVKNNQFNLTVPDNTPVTNDSSQTERLSIQNVSSHQNPIELSEEEKISLQKYRWQEEVGNTRGIWVSIKKQKLYCRENWRQCPLGTNLPKSRARRYLG